MAQDIQSALEALAGDPTFSEGIVGICVLAADGRIIADINSEKMLVPASNMKLISTGAALHALGADYRYETKIGYDGYIDNGTLYGDIHIIGGGDPTTGSKDSIAVSIDRTFAQWENLIRNNGINRIEGDIIGDGRVFEGMAEEPTWLWNDIGSYYGTGATGLMFYENMISFSVSAGKEPDAPVDIKPHYPETPWMTFRYNCRTGRPGTGDQLYMYTSDLAPVAEIRGTFGADKAAKRLDCANKFPEYTCAWHFMRHLLEKGIEVTGEASDFRLKGKHPATETSDLTIMGSTYSPALERIVFETNHASINLYAETLLRTLGMEMTGSACYDSSYVALENTLKGLKMDISRGHKIQDGSGLSRQNHISPDFICRFLDAMKDSDQSVTFVCSLPYPGGNGTLSYNMKGYPASLRERIRVKSGSMNGIRCYSGYVLPSGTGKNFTPAKLNEAIVFSIMTNNCTAPTWKVRPLLDKMMATIAGIN